MKTKLAVILIGLVGVVSCVVKPFERLSAEQLKMDELYQYATDTTQNIAQTSWREIFTDPTLQRLIDTVLNNNFDNEISLLRVEQAYSSLRQARSTFWPTIGVAVEGGSGSVDFGGMTPVNLDAGLNLSWEIDLWGKLGAKKQAALADFWSTQEAAIAVGQSLISATTTAYYSLLALNAQLQVIDQAIENREKYLETTKLFKESGKVTQVAVEQAIAQLEDVRGAKKTTLMNIKTSLNAIALLAGKTKINLDLNSTTIAQKNISNIQLKTGVPAQLLSFRPDVRGAEMTYRQTHYLDMAARAAMYPSLTLGAGFGVTNIISAHSVVLNLLAGLTQPIFNGRALKSQKEIAHAEAKIAEINFKKTFLTAVNEVNNALITVKSYDTILLHQVKQLQALRNADKYSGELFVNGYATYLDVLIAQTSVYQADISVINTFLQAFLARIELYRALGGGAIDISAIPTNLKKHDPLKDKTKKLTKQEKKEAKK